LGLILPVFRQLPDPGVLALLSEVEADFRQQQQASTRARQFLALLVIDRPLVIGNRDQRSLQHNREFGQRGPFLTGDIIKTTPTTPGQPL